MGDIYIRRHGVMWFWRFGRLGGSVYLARPRRSLAADRANRPIAGADRAESFFDVVYGGAQ